ncbi:MAG: hypothetical protein AAGK21_15495 [Bacteroidota bacterium]
MLALLASHDVVFAGEVAERVPFEEHSFEMGSASYEFEVLRQWRGVSGEQLTVVNDGSNCSYALAFDSGTHFLVLTRRGLDGQLRTEMCSTARPVRLGYVSDDRTAGYADPGWVDGIRTLEGDAFIRLDAAAERLAASTDAETVNPFDESWPAPDGPTTGLSIVVSDDLTGAPISADETPGVVVSRYVPGLGSHGQTRLEVVPLSRPARASITLSPGIHAIQAGRGNTHARVHLIATGGDRVVHLRLRKPAP